MSIKELIQVFTDEGDTVIDPVAGSGSALRAAAELGRNAYGFEIDKTFFNGAKEKMLVFQDDSVKVITEQPDVINISGIRTKLKHKGRLNIDN